MEISGFLWTGKTSRKIHCIIHAHKWKFLNFSRVLAGRGGIKYPSEKLLWLLRANSYNILLRSIHWKLWYGINNQVLCWSFFFLLFGHIISNWYIKNYQSQLLKVPLFSYHLITSQTISIVFFFRFNILKYPNMTERVLMNK